MLKSNKGVTLIILVITIIVMSILAGVTIKASNQLITDTQKKAKITNMYIIKAEIEAMYDEYQFSEEMSVLKGTYTEDVSQYGVTFKEEDLWFIWDRDTIKNLGFDENMLTGNEYYIVNYATGEIIYSKGIKDEVGKVEYTFSDILE